MTLPTKTQAQFTSDMVAAWAAALGFQPTLQKGDSLYALMQAVAGQIIFLQAQVQLVNAVARAQTSTGADLDTFYAQFPNFPRLPGTSANGPVVLGSFTPASSTILIPPGVIVQTIGGAIQYQTIPDPSQTAWNATLNAYIMPQGQSSVTVTAQALVPGPNSNVTAGQLSQLGSPLAGISTVSNPANITNGLAPESDAAYRARFPNFINSLVKATYGAIVAAIQGVQVGIEFALAENMNTAGQPQFGEFVASIDDGSGSPPATLIAAVQAALNAVRGFTILAQAIVVQPIAPSISLNINVAPGYVPSAVQSAVQAAIPAATAGFQQGQPLYVSSIEAVALTVPGVVSVQPGATLIAGQNADLTLGPFQAVRITANNVSVGTYV